MAAKNCTRCGEVKNFSEFHVRRASKDGLCPICKSCAIIKVTAWSVSRKDDKRDYDNRYRAEWYPKNRPVTLENVRRTQIRRLGHIIPAWSNRFLIQEIYRLRETRERMLGAFYDVDHIVPIASSPLVCGLHCEDNLQLLPRKENRDRWNKTWPDMPTDPA